MNHVSRNQLPESYLEPFSLKIGLTVLRLYEIKIEEKRPWKLGEYLSLYHSVESSISNLMKSATKPVPWTLNVVQYSTVENNLKNMIEGMTHRLRIPLCYTVV